MIPHSFIIFKISILLTWFLRKNQYHFFMFVHIHLHLVFYSINMCHVIISFTKSACNTTSQMGKHNYLQGLLHKRFENVQALLDMTSVNW